MRYPDFLKEQGTIGFVAPSFGCATEPYRAAFLAAQKRFLNMGHSILPGPNCYADSGIGISNTPEKCAEELNQFYLSDSSDVLISCGGGELMCEIIPFLDFQGLQNGKPKWYMGYSDNTNFTFLSAMLMDTASLYGPCAAAFGMDPWHPAIWDAYRLLCGKKSVFTGYPYWEAVSRKDEEHPYAPYHVTEPSELRAFPDEDCPISGRLIGGCLDCLSNLVGTTYDKVLDFAEKYQKDGIVWFLEACDLNVFSIRRALWQMKHAGWFSNVKGFLVGRPFHYGESMFGLDQYHAVVDILGDFSVPILMDLDIGHLPPMLPLVCGGTALIETKNHNLKISYTWM